MFGRLLSFGVGVYAVFVLIVLGIKHLIFSVILGRRTNVLVSQQLMIDALYVLFDTLGHKTTHACTKLFGSLTLLKVKHARYPFIKPVIENIHLHPSDGIVSVAGPSTVPALWIANCSSSKISQDTQVYLYFHGGGYCVGTPKEASEVHALVLNQLGASTSNLGPTAIIGVDYRLAPEHPYPAGIDDAKAAVVALVHGCKIHPGRIVVGGDSAGGGLSAVVTRVAIDEDIGTLGGMILNSPWVNIATTDDKFRGANDFLTKRSLNLFRKLYVKGNVSKFAEPNVSPIQANLKDLPPTLVVIGGAEVLASDIRLYVDRLKQAGVAVTVLEEPTMCHVYPIVLETGPERERAVVQMASFLQTRWLATARK
eukprot:c8969_g1_i1.p1 GENE.c8969_g1_i1~~c8969_g1_i1.p1  ORF type:complete len:368 (+),score=72.28 c8969_g1_i1:29-1132(+)